MIMTKMVMAYFGVIKKLLNPSGKKCAQFTDYQIEICDYN